MSRSKLALICLLISIPLIIVATRNLLLRDSFLNVSAVDSQGVISVYWDIACTRTANSINWGTLTPGETKEITVFAKNNANETCFLTVATANWNPNNSQTYLVFLWSSENYKPTANQVVKITQNLQVSPKTKGITSFNFNIIFTGTRLSRCDMNKDGKIDVVDIAIVNRAYGSRPGSTYWNPQADVNANGVIDIIDLAMVLHVFGSTI